MNDLDQITMSQREQEYHQIIDGLMNKGISSRNARRLVANQSKKNLKKFRKQVFKTAKMQKPHIEISPEEINGQPEVSVID